jgi:putative flavoprotein involved in K+ transport
MTRQLKLKDSSLHSNDEEARRRLRGGIPVTERFETVIVGGGQAGLSVGYHLARRAQPFVILDANERIGDSWRKRWDSLRLFTPAKFDGLDGMPFPAPRLWFPNKDEMGDYLAAYAARFALSVRTGVKVEGLSKEGDRFVVSSGDRRFEADNVVVATGAERTPRTPAFAGELDDRILQLHSAEYRDPSQLREGEVLVVGIGNSGAEIAHEVVRTHRTWLSGKPRGQLPFRHGPTAARFAFPVVRFLGHRVLTRRTPIGRKIVPKLIAHGQPLIRTKLKDLAAAGVEQVPRTVGVKDGYPELADGRVLTVSNVIWCTGFRYDFGWIDLPVFGEDGEPMHRRGIVDSEPGLYFMGLLFQYAVSSNVLPGMGRDAEYIARHIASRSSNSHAVERPRTNAAVGRER